jgi:hypothetical protein
VEPAVPARDDELITIGELRRNPSSHGPIRVELVPLAGSGDDSYVEATDDTGKLTLAILGETENARELTGSTRIFDVWLAPVAPGYQHEIDEGFDAVHAAYPQFDLGGIPQIDDVATKIVPVRE